jgi:hypothetical protein
MHKRSTEGSIEQAIEKAWYPNEEDPVSIYMWVPLDARREFSRDMTTVLRTAVPRHYWMSSRTKWITQIKEGEKVIKARMAEALISDSEYVRTYAELLLIQARARKEHNAKLRAARRKST